ncbi:MAG: hypothetical protein ABSF98_27085 [Bryobacteraceae bacterium]|jgi:hypothetical protein
MADSKSRPGCLNVLAALFVLALVVGAWRTCRKSKPDADSIVQTGTSAPDESRALLTELKGSMARRREDDLWLIANIHGILNSKSPQEKVLVYCMATVYGAEHLLDSAPETEYELQADGTVRKMPGKPPKTPEQRFREDQRIELELETGGDPVVQDCAGSLFWFGTWNNKPMRSDEKFNDDEAKARADMEEIDKMLDPRLVERLPKLPNAASPNPPAAQAPSQAVEQPADTSRLPVTPQPPAVPSPPPPPPAQAPSPTSGVLRATVESEHGEAVFENLPGERLRFTFDHTAWQATIHRQPNGTQTLVMRSLKPGAYAECDVRWEIVR